MFTDIVILNGNEAEFKKMAKKLGFDNLIFINHDAIVAKNSNEINKLRNKFKYIFADKDWAFNDKRLDLIFNQELNINGTSPSVAFRIRIWLNGVS